eukprot:TRINITY_DN26954_c0_g1_i1.p2 TRINITY_DN26954_c0_g1~~TRINITY_DN26954_c0_g1_i1.p2  ORF type:complete len:416 (+),score=68.56 TRINITY_DN26954_c0_g1_i1:61-1248(+)
MGTSWCCKAEAPTGPGVVRFAGAQSEGGLSSAWAQGPPSAATTPSSPGDPTRVSSSAGVAANPADSNDVHAEDTAGPTVPETSNAGVKSEAKSGGTRGSSSSKAPREGTPPPSRKSMRQAPRSRKGRAPRSRKGRAPRSSSTGSRERSAQRHPGPTTGWSSRRTLLPRRGARPRSSTRASSGEGGSAWGHPGSGMPDTPCWICPRHAGGCGLANAPSAAFCGNLSCALARAGGELYQGAGHSQGGGKCGPGGHFGDALPGGGYGSEDQLAQLWHAPQMPPRGAPPLRRARRQQRPAPTTKRQAAAAAALAQEAAVAAMLEAERQARARRLLPVDDSDYESDDDGSAGYPDTPRASPPTPPTPRPPQLPSYKSLLWWAAVGGVLLMSGARDNARRA